MDLQERLQGWQTIRKMHLEVKTIQMKSQSVDLVRLPNLTRHAIYSLRFKQLSGLIIDLGVQRCKFL